MKRSLSKITLLSLLFALSAVPSQQLRADIISWGSAGSSEAFAKLTNVVALSGGNAMALLSDGTVMSVDSATPLPGFTNVIAISSSFSSRLALQANGTVLATADSALASPVGVSNVVSIACGETETYNSHSFGLALLKDGTVFGWGGNDRGEISIPAGLKDVRAVAAERYSMALKTDGTVVAWGLNPQGAQVPPELTGVAAIALGYPGALALKSNATVVEWDVTTGQYTETPAGLSNIVAISASWDTRIALRSDGVAIQWGTEGPSRIQGVSLIAASAYGGMAYGLTPMMSPWGEDLHFDHNGTSGELELSPGVIGTPPLRYQWLRNNIPVPGGTNSTLTFVEATGAIYSLLISNSLGEWVVGGEKVPRSIPPPNDNFADAQIIPTVGGRLVGSAYLSTPEPNEPRHLFTKSGRTVWYRWTAPSTGEVTLDTIGSNLDTLLVVYTGTSLSDLTFVAADDDSGIFERSSKLTFVATAGTDYKIVVVALGPVASDEWLFYDWDESLARWKTPIDWGSEGDTSLQLHLYADEPLINLTRGAGREFTFNVGGRASQVVVIEASTNMKEWQPIATNAVPESGVLSYVDGGSGTTQARFFRARFH